MNRSLTEMPKSGLYEVPRRVLVAFDVALAFSGEDQEDAIYAAKAHCPDLEELIDLVRRGRATVTIVDDTVDGAKARYVGKDRGY